MTIVSRGYEGSIVANGPWAEMNQVYGHEYVASHYDAGRVSIVTSGTRTVRVNVGPVVKGLRTGIGGHGVFDAITVAEDITITDALPATGQVKWYLVAARRTWQTAQSTSVVVVTGTAAEALPTRMTTPGTIDDQPLALVQITGGQTVPTAIRDLRPVSRNGAYVVDPAARDLVMAYFNQVGYRLIAGTDEYTRVVSPDGTASWSPRESLANVTAFGDGWEATPGAANTPRVRRVGNQVFLYGSVRRKRAGSDSGANLLSIPAGFTPSTTATRAIGTTVLSNAQFSELFLSGAVVSSAAGYGSFSPAVGVAVPLACSWWLD